MVIVLWMILGAIAFAAFFYIRGAMRAVAMARRHRLTVDQRIVLGRFWQVFWNTNGRPPTPQEQEIIAQRVSFYSKGECDSLCSTSWTSDQSIAAILEIWFR